MKSLNTQASIVAALSSLSSETKLCFGAAGGGAFIGAAGYAINALTTSETTLSAFLVISAFYLIAGVISFFKSSPEYLQVRPVANGSQMVVVADEEDDRIESAA